MAYVIKPQTIAATVPFGDSAYGAVTYNGTVYINTADSIYKYQTVNNTFTLLHNKVNNTITDCVLFNGALYTIGYLANSSGVAVYKYDIETGVYSTFTSQSGSYLNRVFIGGAAYYREEFIILTMLFMGGTGYTGRVYTYSYNTTTNSGMWYYNNSPSAYEYYCVAHQITDYFYYSAYVSGSGVSGSQLLYGPITSVKESTGMITNTTLGETPANFKGVGTFKFDNLYYIICGDSVYTYNATANVFAQLSITTPFTVTGKYCAQIDNDVYMFYASGVYKLSFVDYALIYTVRQGESILLTLTDQSPITKLRFNYSTGSTVGYIFTELSGDVSGTFDITIPEKKQLVGFSNKENDTRAVFPLNTDIDYPINSDFTFYPVFSTYNPPTTTFNINLYKSSAETHRVDKTNYLESVGVLSGALRAECSVTRPSIVVQMDTLPVFNYAYIPAFNRYYFVENGPVSVGKNLWRINFNCDVLMSYKEGIDSLTAIIARQENDYNEKLVDDMVPVTKNKLVTWSVIASDVFNTQAASGISDPKPHNFVLTAIKGGATT